MAVTVQDRRRTFLTRSIRPRTHQNQSSIDHDGVFRRWNKSKEHHLSPSIPHLESHSGYRRPHTPYKVSHQHT